MSYFDDQFDAWMDGGCQGAIEDADPFTGFEPEPEPKPKRPAKKPSALRQAKLARPKRKRVLAGVAEVTCER